jgi:hypothetical protein
MGHLRDRLEQDLILKSFRLATRQRCAFVQHALTGHARSAGWTSRASRALTGGARRL